MYVSEKVVSLTAYGYVWRYIDNDNNIVNDGYKKKEEKMFKIEDIV